METKLICELTMKIVRMKQLIHKLTSVIDNIELYLKEYMKKKESEL